MRKNIDFRFLGFPTTTTRIPTYCSSMYLKNFLHILNENEEKLKKKKEIIRVKSIKLCRKKKKKDKL